MWGARQLADEAWAHWALHPRLRPWARQGTVSQRRGPAGETQAAAEERTLRAEDARTLLYFRRCPFLADLTSTKQLWLTPWRELMDPRDGDLNEALLLLS